MGLGIFSYGDFYLEKEDSHSDQYRYVLPIRVNGECCFLLVAVWAMNEKVNVRQRYIGQVYCALQHYKELLGGDVLIAGDFNWNRNFVGSRPLYGGFEDVLRILGTHEIESCYHCFRKEDFGKETLATFYHYRKHSKPYHIDYCFASTSLMERNLSTTVGSYDDWIQYSDHMPLVIDFGETEAM